MERITCTLWREVKKTLRVMHMWKRLLQDVRFKWSHEAAAMNKDNPRSFAFVDGYQVCVAPAIEALNLNNQCGILLHELGHIGIELTDTDKLEVPPEVSETLADLCVIRFMPACDYRYERTVHYHADEVILRTASFLQRANYNVFWKG